MRLLIIEDFGTTGLMGAVDVKDNGQFCGFWRRFGRSNKKQAQGGRWGLGKLVFPSASQVRTVVGLTRRANGPSSWLMGQAILRNHQIGGIEKDSVGFWCDTKAARKGMPTSDPALCRAVSAEAGLVRTDEPGLSLIVPHVLPDIEPAHLMAAAIRNYLDPRLKASLVVPYEDPDASRTEIRRRAGDRRFAHVLMLTRTGELMGRRRYWPIYEAACEAGLPVGVHVFGYSGRAASNTGWPSFYIEEMTEHSCACQAQVTSLIMEGVFETFPQLKIVMIEAGFGWMPALGHRLDRNWKRMRAAMPHLKRAPSEYLHDHFWVTTQPMEEPENPAHLVDIMTAIGFDRILFSSDYPHWDFDDPFVVVPASLGDERRKQIYSGNAHALYGF
jgi:predicted TIM-barrel fold metal-dependent hydrolase